MLKTSLLKMGCPHANSTYKTHNPVGIRLLTRLSLSLIQEHKFDMILLIAWTHYAPAVLNLRLQFIFFALPQLLKHHLIKKLFDKIKLPGETLWELNNECLLTVLLFRSKIYKEQVNVQILNASIYYIINTDRFTGSLI